MPRELRRLLLSPERLSAAGSDGRVSLSSDECHYLKRVLRLRSGDAFAVVDGAGQLWQAQLEGQLAVLQQPLAQPLERQPAADVRLQLAVAMPRRDGDVLLRMATELGIDRFVPLQAARSVAERWNAQRSRLILREAVEQSERLWAPELSEPQAASAWFSAEAATDAAGSFQLRLLATTRQAGLPQLSWLLSSEADIQPQPATLMGPASLTVAIGPEGGWSPEEEMLAQAHGWRAVTLGPTILRSSTAAVTAAVLMVSWRQGLSCGTCRPPSP